jgi:hypothetical protein
MYQAHSEVMLQQHSAGVEVCAVTKKFQHLFASLAAFVHSSEMHLNRGIGRRQIDPDCHISAWREGPIESGTNVVDLAAKASELFGRKRGCEIRQSGCDKVAEKRRVTPRDLIDVAALRKLAERVRTGGFQQAPPRTRLERSEHDKRFIEQRSDAVNYAGSTNLPPLTAATLSTVKPPWKTARRQSNSCSPPVRRSKLQSSVARNVRCRGRAERRPLVSS